MISTLAYVRSIPNVNPPNSSQKHPIQFSVGLPQPVYAFAYMLTQVIYRERKQLSCDKRHPGHQGDYRQYK